MNQLFRRTLKDRIARTLLVLAALGAVIPLICIFAYVLSQGAQALGWSLFTALPVPVGETGGGMANAFIGSLIVVGIAALIGVPWGMMTGVYLSEYARGRFAQVVRFSVDLLASIPSIVVGLFVFAMIVVTMKRFSAFAGGIALAILMVPTVARTTEELLKMVPTHIREAGLALGIPRWKVVLFIVLRGSLRGISTGVLLAVARVSGETAPLLFTAFSSRLWSFRPDQPIATVPVQIYNYAISPYPEWHRLAWGGALVLLLVVFFLNFFTRLLLRIPGGKA